MYVRVCVYIYMYVCVCVLRVISTGSLTISNQNSVERVDIRARRHASHAEHSLALRCKKRLTRALKHDACAEGCVWTPGNRLTEVPVLRC